MKRNQLDFAVFCIENIATKLEMNGADVYALLTEKSDILDTYIVAHYDALHTQGQDYIVQDIIELMREEGLV